MEVYRYLSQSELDAILANNISEIGHEYPTNKGYERINNHRYKTGVKYLHFFRHKKDCAKMRFNSEDKDDEFYIAQFEIPITALFQHIGFGYYLGHGYDVDIEKALEFAIPTSKFKSSYLISYVRDEAHHCAIEKRKGTTLPGLER